MLPSNLGFHPIWDWPGESEIKSEIALDGSRPNSDWIEFEIGREHIQT